MDKYEHSTRQYKTTDTSLISDIQNDVYMTCKCVVKMRTFFCYVQTYLQNKSVTFTGFTTVFLFWSVIKIWMTLWLTKAHTLYFIKNKLETVTGSIKL